MNERGDSWKSRLTESASKTALAISPHGCSNTSASWNNTCSLAEPSKICSAVELRIRSAENQRGASRRACRSDSRSFDSQPINVVRGIVHNKVFASNKGSFVLHECQLQRAILIT